MAAFGDSGAMARVRKERPPTTSEQLEKLLGYPWPFPGRSPKHNLLAWIVTDDWHVPPRWTCSGRGSATSSTSCSGRADEVRRRHAPWLCRCAPPSLPALLRTLVAASSGKSAAFGVQSSVPEWRAREDSNP